MIDKYEDSEITEDEFLDLDDLCWDLQNAPMYNFRPIRLTDEDSEYD